MSRPFCCNPVLAALRLARKLTTPCSYSLDSDLYAHVVTGNSVRVFWVAIKKNGCDPLLKLPYLWPLFMHHDASKNLIVRMGAFSLTFVLLTVFKPSFGLAEGTWQGIRISGSGASGWQPVVCENGNGWRTCEMPINITLTASPPSIPADGSTTTITATVTDYFGVSVGQGTLVNWYTNLGNLDGVASPTSPDGVASIRLTSVPVVSPATVTAVVASDGVQATIVIPFNDVWIPAPSLYTAWANYGSPYNCSPWSPSAAEVSAGTTFTQSTNCSQAQIAYRQDREQSRTSGTFRNVGQPVQLSQLVGVTLNQTAVGSKQPPPAPAPPPPPPAPPPTASHPWTQCFFELEPTLTSGSYVWSLASDGNDASTVAWNSFFVLGISTRAATSMVIDGVTYYRGAYKQNSGTAENYEVCR